MVHIDPAGEGVLRGSEDGRHEVLRWEAGRVQQETKPATRITL